MSDQEQEQAVPDEEGAPEVAEPGEAQPEGEDAEAEEAGEESPDTDVGQPEQPEQPEQPSGVTEAEWEARFKKAGQRFDTYQRAIFGIFEEAAHDLVQCPLCLQVPGFVDKNAAGRVPEEQAALVKHFLGLAREIEYRRLPGFETCEACGGEGKGLSGSNDPQHRLKPCPTCKGRGYKGPDLVESNGHVPGVPAVTEPAAFSADGARDDVDEWNEPRILPDGRENPNFGRMPHRKIQVEPWGVTAGLTAQDAVSA